MVAFVFLGHDCIGGVSPTLAATLGAVELDLRGEFIAAGSPGTFNEFCAIREPYRGQHQGGPHTPGDAIDVNFSSNPYIATRSPTSSGGVQYGGEAAGASLVRARIAASVVYDRVIAFAQTQSDVADVSGRSAGESSSSVHDRFKQVSDALTAYLGLAFQVPAPSSPNALVPNNPLGRSPVANATQATLAQLLASIPLTERIDENQARASISTTLTSPAWLSNHAAWSTDVDFWLRQILRDYEVVRIPMVVGPPSASPPMTRNPAFGFMDLTDQVALSLCDVGNLRWGISDFGPSESGDVQHFDMRARIESPPGSVQIDITTDAGVQQALASLEFDPGAVDGNRGNNPATSHTLAAVSAFRMSAGLGVTMPPTFADLDDQAMRDALTVALDATAIPHA